MEMSITTPSLLFPAISLLMLAYTNRFITLANVIRQLSNLENARSEAIVRRQIENLRKRLQIIRAIADFWRALVSGVYPGDVFVIPGLAFCRAVTFWLKPAFAGCVLAVFAL